MAFRPTPRNSPAAGLDAAGAAAISQSALCGQSLDSKSVGASCRFTLAQRVARSCHTGGRDAFFAGAFGVALGAVTQTFGGRNLHQHRLGFDELAEQLLRVVVPRPRGFVTEARRRRVDAVEVGAER